MSREELARRLWAEHEEAAFPEALCDDIDGISIPVVDADAAGCISRWIGKPNAFHLAEPHRSWLAQCVEDLERVLPRVRDQPL